jgi:hypothetical protein
MHKTVFIAIILCLTLSALGYSQGKPHARPDTAREESLPVPKDDNIKDDNIRDPQPIAEQTPDAEFFTISKQVDEVNLILTVTDSKGRFVDNLSPDDLKLLDNHKSPGKWNYFQARTNLPLSVILAIDVSSSVRDRLPFEQQAARVFFKQIMRKETDEAAIIAFGSSVQEKNKGMTHDVNVLDRTIHSLQAGGDTAMYDAIILASHRLRARRRGVVRPVVILITDGDDTASKASLQAAEEAAIRSEEIVNSSGRGMRDPIELEVFKNLYHSIAEEMGAALRRTSFSPNIKERRDYSCAIFDSRGNVIAMGDHMPVHLGSMPMSVAAAIEQCKLDHSPFEPGDVIMLNDPFRGGTHLPDITLVMPVYVAQKWRDGRLARPRASNRSSRAPDFYVASRAHHADVGGTYPGSMGPCREIYQEGLRIPPVKIMRGGEIVPDVLALLLTNVRTPEEREGDLGAQIAACQTGAQRLAKSAPAMA